MLGSGYGRFQVRDAWFLGRRIQHAEAENMCLCVWSTEAVEDVRPPHLPTAGYLSSQPGGPLEPCVQLATRVVCPHTGSRAPPTVRKVPGDLICEKGDRHSHAVFPLSNVCVMTVQLALPYSVFWRLGSGSGIRVGGWGYGGGPNLGVRYPPPDFKRSKGKPNLDFGQMRSGTRAQ